MITKAYAHSLPNEPDVNKWQPRDEHLKSVAEKAKDFGLSFAGNIRIESAQDEEYAIYRCCQAFVWYGMRVAFVMTLLAHPGHTLVKHLAATAEKAAEFAQYFGGQEHARLAGLLHDLGEAETEFTKKVAL